MCRAARQLQEQVRQGRCLARGPQAKQVRNVSGWARGCQLEVVGDPAQRHLQDRLGLQLPLGAGNVQVQVQVQVASLELSGLIGAVVDLLRGP